MEFLSQWARGIISIVILSAFLELLLPKGTTQKYVKLAMGLIIIIFMITPLTKIRKVELPKTLEVSYEDYASLNIQDTYIKRLEEKVEETLGISNVEITVNPDDISQIIYVRSGEKHKEIAQLLGLTIDKVGD